jgi:hypothetical protein
MNMTQMSQNGKDTGATPATSAVRAAAAVEAAYLLDLIRR